MNKKRFLGLAVLIVLFSVSSVCAGQFEGKFKGKDRNHGFKKGEFMKELGLSEEQQAQLKEYREQNREENKASREKMKELRDALKTELDKYNSDSEKINQITSEMKALEGGKIDGRVDSIQQIKKVLTPEQFEQFKQKIDKMKKKHMKDGGKMRRKFHGEGEEPSEFDGPQE